MNEEEYDKKWNAYLYPGTNTLKNKLGITDYDELAKREAEITFEKLVELYENPIKGDFDVLHLCNIHEYIFGDIYEWAGEYRNVYMQKNNSYFAEVENIDFYLKEDLKMLNEKINKVNTKMELADLIGDFFISLQNIHPFREGNGRSIREFLREFVLEKTPMLPCGAYEIDFTKIDGKELNKNMVLARAFKGPVIMQFMNALVPVEKEKTNKI